jgi:hypothetical protein
MNRSHVALFLVLGAPVALYAGVLVPRNIPDRTDEPTNPAAYFPTAVGTKWVYQVTTQYRGRPGRSERAEIITDVTEYDGERLVRLREIEGDSSYTQREWAVSDNQVRYRLLREPRYWDRGRRDEEPEPWRVMFPAGMKPGATWADERPNDRTRRVYTMAGWETVRVPAGAYFAARMNVEIIDFKTTGEMAGTTTGSMWFAPGVGYVKFELVSNFAPFKLVTELKSFSTPTGK